MQIDRYKQQLCGHLPPILKTHREKPGWETNKNATSYFEQLLEVTSHLKNHQRRTSFAGHSLRNKDELINDVLLWIPTWPLTSHLKNHPSKTNRTCGTLLEKQGRTHKRRSSMDPKRWTYKCWSTSKNLSTSVL